MPVSLAVWKAARPIFGWQGYEFELQGDAREHLAQLQAVLEARTKPPIIIERDQIYDLSQYGARVIGIGQISRLSPRTSSSGRMTTAGFPRI